MLVFLLLLLCSPVKAAEPELGARLLFYPIGSDAHFLVKAVKRSDTDSSWFYYRNQAVSIIEPRPGEWVSSFINTIWEENQVTHEIFAWGKLSGNSEDFAGRLQAFTGKEPVGIAFNKIEKSPLARLVCAGAESGKALSGIPAYKKWAKVSDGELQHWEALFQHLASLNRQRNVRGENLDLYSVFTGISAIRETLQIDVDLANENPVLDRACNANLRIIQSAVEMYNMDHSTMMQTLDLQALVEGGYLKSKPTCRSGREYYGKNLGSDGMIRCPAHGDINNPRPDDGLVVDNTARVKVAGLEGPKAPSHPWRKMIKNPNLVLPEVYRLIPSDCAFIHFPSYSSFRKAFDFFADWASALGTMAGGDSGSSNFGLEKRIKDQLLLKTDMLTRLFADLALSDIVFVCEDPFIFEGSAVAVVLKITNETMLREKLAMTANEFRSENPAISENTLMMGGRKVQAFTSPDFRYRSYRLLADGHQIISNSPLLMEKFISVLDGKTPALTEFLDLHYFYEHIEKNFKQPGRIFSFLSDAFIRKIIGPACKIATRRRLECIRQSLLQTHELMVNDGKLDETLTCPEGGVYEVVDGEISCTVHRVFGRMTPVSERLPVEATPEEASSYATFVAQYNQYFSQFFDPIGFVFSTEPEFTGRLLIMPLVENGIYSELQKNVRHEPMNAGPQPQNDILKVGVNLQAANLPVPGYWLSNIAYQKRLELVGRWFTGCVWAHLADHPLLFHWDSNLLARGILGAFSGGRTGMMGLSPAILSFFSPVLFAIELTDESHFDSIIDWVRNEIAGSINNSGFMGPAFKLDQLEENGVKMYVFSFELFAIRKTYYLTLRDGFFLVASKKELLFNLEEAPAYEKNAFSGNFNLVFYPAKIRLMRPDLLEVRARSQRETCLENLKNLHFVSTFHPDQTEKFYQIVYAAQPVCPAGGTYSSVMPVSCSQHGTISGGVLKPVSDFFKGVGAISIQSFIDSEGFQSEVRFFPE